MWAYPDVEAKQGCVIFEPHKVIAVIEILVFNYLELLFKEHVSRYFFPLCFTANSKFKICFFKGYSPNILQLCESAAESLLKQSRLVNQ